MKVLTHLGIVICFLINYFGKVIVMSNCKLKGRSHRASAAVARLNHGQKTLPVKQTLLDAVQPRFSRDTAVLHPWLHAVRNSHARKSFGLPKNL